MNYPGLRYSLRRTAFTIAHPRGLVAVGLIAWATAASFFVFQDIHSPFRSLISLSFLLLAPGLAVARLLRLDDRLMQLSLALALSLALDALVATLLLYANAWSVESIFFILAYLTFVTALVDLVRSHTRLLNNVAPRRSIWRVRVGLVVAVLLGAVLLFFFITARSPTKQATTALDNRETDSASIAQTPNANLNEIERLRRTLSVIVFGAEEPDSQSHENPQGSEQ